MVKDSRFSMPRSKRIKRKSSWKDTFRDFTSGSDRELESPSNSKVPRFLSAPQSPSNRSVGGEGTSDDVGALADAENGEDEDLGHRKEEDLPISARVRYAYPHTVSWPVSRNNSELGYEQPLSPALEESNKKIEEGLTKGKEPIGTRLTMTSRTGYFQDRIVSPSMVRLPWKRSYKPLKTGVDACNGNLVHWASSKSGFRY